MRGVLLVLPRKETDQADQVHREPEGEVYPAGPAGCGGARETQTHQEQNQETAETASERPAEGEASCSLRLCSLSTLDLHERLCSVQLEEVRSVPASSEKIITEASAHKEELENKRLVEEQKLAQVMESLKEETSGLQEDKEVRSCLVCDARSTRTFPTRCSFHFKLTMHQFKFWVETKTAAENFKFHQQLRAKLYKPITLVQCFPNCGPWPPGGP